MATLPILQMNPERWKATWDALKPLREWKGPMPATLKEGTPCQCVRCQRSAPFILPFTPPNPEIGALFDSVARMALEVCGIPDTMLGIPDEIPVTPEMRKAGGEALRERCQEHFGTSWCYDIAWDFAEVAYRAMREADPLRAMDDGIGFLYGARRKIEMERDALSASCAAVTDAYDVRGQVLRETYEERDRSIAAVATLRLDLERLEFRAITAEVECMHLRDALARCDANQTDGTAEPPLGNRPHDVTCASRAIGLDGTTGKCDCGAMHNPFREFPTDRRRIGR